MSMYSGIGSFVKKYQEGGEAQSNGDSGLPLLGGNTSGSFGSYEEWKASLDPQIVESMSEDQLRSIYDGAIKFGASGTSGVNTSTGSNLPSYARVGDDGRIIIDQGTTNRQFIQLLNILGYFADADPYDYEWLLKHFSEGSNAGDGLWLATAYRQNKPLDVSSIAGMNFTDQNKGVFTRLFESVNAGIGAGGFNFGGSGSVSGQPGDNYGGTDGATGGTSSRPVFIGQPPTGGTLEQPSYSLSDVLVSSSEQPNLYDRFDLYPEGGFQVTDPYSGTVTQSSPYPAAPPLPGITPVTTPATSVEGTVGEPTTTTSTTPTGGTGAPPADPGTTTTDTTDPGTTTTGTGTTTTGTTTTGTTTTGTTSVRGLPSYSDIEKAIMNVEGLEPGPRKYGSGSISGIERSYQRKRARQHVSDIFRQYLGRGAESSAIDYYAPMVLQAASLGGNRGRQAYFNIIDEIKNSEEGQLFAQSGRDPLAPKMDYYATPEPWYTDQLANVDFSQEYLSPADYAGVNDYIFGKRGILGGQRVKQDSLRNLSTQEFMDLLAAQSGTGTYGGDLIYDPNQGIIYSGISDRMDEARRQNFLDTLASRRERYNAMPSGIDPSLLTETEKVRARHLYGGYGTTSMRIGDTQYFVNDDGTISALDVQDVDYDFTPGFAEGGIVDVYSGDMANMQTTGEGIESFLNPERSKATLRRNLAKLAPRPTVPVMQQGIMPMAR